LARSSALEGLAFRPLLVPGREAGALFAFVGAWTPAEAAVDRGWAAWEEGRLVGALLSERAGSAALLHGPVVVAPEAAGVAGEPTSPTAEGETAVEIAARLLALVLEEAPAHGVDTLFARPQGLDRLWVRFGFIPVPEVELPSALRGRPGLGLYGWRGASALWSMAGRTAGRRTASAGR
jgi:hypothetical protein